MTAARCSTTREIYCEISQQVFNIWLQPDNVSDNAAGSKRDRAKRADRPIPARVHPFVLCRLLGVV
jgi:hypothetical protein